MRTALAIIGLLCLLSGNGEYAWSQENPLSPKNGNGLSAANDSNGAEKEKAEKAIESAIRKKRYREAYHLANQLVDRYPRDLDAIYLLAYIQKQISFLRKALVTAGRGLRIDPQNVDLLILKAEILIRQGHLDEAREILVPLKSAHPESKTIDRDLLKTYFPGGHETLLPPMDQHVFSLGVLQAPFAPDSFLVYTLPRWGLGLEGLGINYTGGTVFIGDAQLQTPMADRVRFIAGRTEYLGFATGQSQGLNAWTYAGIDARPTDRLGILFEAGDTSLARAGLYGHLYYTLGQLTIDVQGMDNMVWGDFGQSIILNGFESGVMADASLQITPRISAGVNYWYFDYVLNNGTLPYGNLHNAFGYLDYLFIPDPDVDLLAGYDDWTVMADPTVASLVPEIARQQYFLVALNFMKNFDSGLGLNAQIGGFNDFYNHLTSYEGAAGLRYPVSEHWSVYGNAVYFNESTLYSGPSEEVMLGVNILF